MMYLRAALAILACSVEVFGAGYYTIVAPSVLRPNSDYHVAVSTQQVSEPTTVSIEVGGRQDAGNTVQIRQTVSVPPYTTRVVKIEIGDLGPGTYNLTARGSDGLEFENSTSLQYLHKSYSVFIQTDKAIYKPGHKIQFRAIVLNSHLKPQASGALDIFITDGKGNRVKAWNRALTTKGVFSEELQLSENPVLGAWNITVTVLDQTFTKSIQVAEYVLPKFEVSISIPEHATFKDSHLVATVHAKYTYGKPVKGEATITAYPTYFSGVLQPIFQTPVRKVVPIDGKATVEFNIARDLQLTDEFERTVRFEVAVEEALTGRRQNNSAEMTVHKHKYAMELVKTSEYFKPGLKYTAFIKLAHHDGSPVRDDKNPVVVRSGYSYDHDLYKEEKFKLNKNGLIELTFFPPVDQNHTTLGLEATYLDLQEWFSAISASMSPSNTFIQAVLKTEKPKVNSEVEVIVNSTRPLRYYSYQVLGRGDILLADTVQLSSPANSHSFRFLATYAMAPSAHVIVQYVTPAGEIVADSLDIELDGAMQNFVNVKMNPSDTQPGEKVEISIETKPNSYVGLLGIDQSVLLLKSGNDISQADVLDELGSYDSGDESPYRPMYRGRFRNKRSFFWWPGSATAQEVFQKSGAVILTNGLVHEHFPFVYYRSNFEDGSMELFGQASSTSDSAVKDNAGVRVRRNFPETWLWQMLDAGFDGRATLRKTAPDTITSWIITAFSVDPVFGLGLTEQPSKLRIFRPFFVSIDLPNHVIRGEIVALPIVVFNYMDKDVVADVTLENQGLENFEFADISNDVRETPKVELYRRKRVTVKANSGASVSFMITPKKIGLINLKVTANSPLAGDAVERQLLVKAEGETQYINKAVFVDLRNSSSFSSQVLVDIPKTAVQGSEFIEVSAVGDILGPSIPNLANLIKMPSGCGEQNMLNFVPNIVIIDYLKNTRQLTPAIEGKALRFMETGYQQELTYRRKDGSFSAFGASDANGSTWLTAFVAKSFRQAMSHINIEEKVILEALQWLASNQAGNGSFPEVGKVSHRDMQGGAAKGLALTAFTLIAFLENQAAAPLYRNTINKAVDYLVRNLDALDDPYAAAITCYALNLANHPNNAQACNLLESKVQSSDGMRWWKKPMSKDDEKNPWHSLASSVDVEMTAYGLLSYIQRGLVTDALPIMKWLVTQRNDQGGFASTQDTVIGIYALAKLAEQITSGSTDLSIKFAYQVGKSSSINVNRGNNMILQKHELPTSVRSVNISATGSGFAIVQVSYRYNENVTGAWPLFTLDPQVDRNSDQNHLQLSICSGFVGGAVNESNMAVMEVSLPSGFTVDTDSLPSLQASQNVMRVETKEGDTTVVLYFDKMTRKEYCPTVSAFRTHKVANQKPVPVTVYDYYDSSRRARVFYEARVATLCDICEGEDCNTCSSRRDSGSNQGQTSSAARSNAIPALGLILTLLALRVREW